MIFKSRNDFFYFLSGGALAIRNNNNNSREHYINDEIKAVLGAPSKIVRVIGPEGEQMGLLTEMDMAAFAG